MRDLKLSREGDVKQGLFGFHVKPNGEAEGTIVYYNPKEFWEEEESC